MIPRSTTITAEGRRLRRVLVWTAVLVVAGNLVVALLGPLLRGQRVTGPAGSSYVTTALGTAAYAELLEEEDFEVERLRAPLTQGRLPAGSTLVMIEAGFSSIAPPELSALADFVASGGRLLVAGADPPDLVEALTPDRTGPEWMPTGPPQARSTLPDVGTVPLAGRGSIRGGGDDQVLLRGEDGRVVAVEWWYREGRVIWVADPEPFLNRGLAAGDSAGFVVSLLEGDTVVFDEYLHGYGGDGLVDSLPEGWPTTLLILGLAALSWLVAYGRRLGPPQPTARDLAPERAAYLDSLAGILGRTGRIEEAAAPVGERARRLLAARGGLGAEPSDEDLRRVARDIGLPAGDVDRWLQDGEVSATGRVLARLVERR